MLVQAGDYAAFIFQPLPLRHPVDCRDYGLSRDLWGEHTCEEMAGDAIALASELGWKRFDMVGHSMSGLPVQRVADENCVKSAGVITPVPASGTRAARRQSNVPCRQRDSGAQTRNH